MTQTSAQATCQSCTKPTNGVVLCSTCRRTTHHAIANVAVFNDDLDTLRTGQTRYGVPSKGSIGKSRPLGMDIRFTPGGQGAKIQLAVRTAVVLWTRRLMAERPGDQPEHDSVRSLCAYLDRNLGAIVTTEWAGDFKADMLSLERSLSAIVDRPPESWYAGACGAVIANHDENHCACSCHRFPANGACDVPDGDCGTDQAEVTCVKVLYAEPGQDYVRCRDCRTEWPVQARRDILVREAQDRQATVRMLARVVTTLGASDASEAKLESRINTWVHRGRLTADGSRVVDGRVRPTYRVGDVLDLLARDIGDRTDRISTRREQATERAS